MKNFLQNAICLLIFTERTIKPTINQARWQCQQPVSRNYAALNARNWYSAKMKTVRFYST
jgi:hypothetical protein